VQTSGGGCRRPLVTLLKRSISETEIMFMLSIYHKETKSYFL